MKRELFIHFAFWFSFFVLISIFNNLLNLSYWPFWAGGLLGLVLPDLDHFIYVYFVKPTDLSSQRINYTMEKRQWGRSVQLLYETRNERQGLVFHTIFFQLIFLVLTFWLITSSSSIFGKGLVLSFGLHLLIDQLVDIIELKNLNNWMKYIPIDLDLNKSKIYWLVVTLLTIVLGLVI